MNQTFLQAIADLTPKEKREHSEGPIILHEGRYRLYEKPDGTLRVQYLKDGSEVEEFAEIPAVVIHLAKAMQDGSMSPVQMMAEASKLMMSIK